MAVIHLSDWREYLHLLAFQPRATTVLFTLLSDYAYPAYPAYLWSCLSVPAGT